MKKSLVALALFGAFAATAQAQSSVQIYGTIDAGLGKATGSTTAVTKRDNNKLGFKGTEDLGNGLKAIFQLEIRYESDTGTLENNSRPLFQGQSRVGLQGNFGTVRLGRGLTAFQEASTAFEPWSGMPTKAGFQTDITVAGYTSDPLSAAGNSQNRFSNAVFYNSPVVSGFQFNATVAAKEANGFGGIGLNQPTPANVAIRANPSGNYAVAANAAPASNPYSMSATYTNEQFAAMAAYERNGVQAKLWSIAASFNPVKELKLMASYQHQDDGNFKIINTDTKAWLIGANYDVGPGKIRAGYGQKTPDGTVKTKQASLGYDYNLSKRTYVYADISNKKAANTSNYNASTTTNYVGIGVHHNF